MPIRRSMDGADQTFLHISNVSTVSIQFLGSSSQLNASVGGFTFAASSPDLTVLSFSGPFDGGWSGEGYGESESHIA